MVGGMNKWEWETVKCIDLKEAIIALQVALDLRPDQAEMPDDINGDGKIGLAEAIYILQRVADQRCN